MKFCVKNKLLSVGEGSTVKDENGKDLFKVKGSAFSFTKKKKIYDMQGKLLYVVNNKFINWWKQTSFVKDAQGQLVCKVKNRGFKSGYDVTDCADEIAINGVLLRGCQITKNEKVVGAITTQYLSVSDTYNVDLNDDEDPAFFTAIIIAMDNIKDNVSKS